MNEWISTINAIPDDGQRVWVNTKMWGVMPATFYLKDRFNRENMFVNFSGGHLSISEITHFQEMYVPNEPKVL